jgi:hypothetical protein
MKKYKFKSVLILSLIALFACESDYKIGYDESIAGFNLRMVPEATLFDIAQGDPSLNFKIYSDSRDIDQVTIEVELFQFAAGTTTDKGVLLSIDGSELKSEGQLYELTLSDYAAAVGLTLAEVGSGDMFTVYNRVEMADGRVYPDTLELNGDEFVNVENSFFTVANSTSFTTTLSFPVICPFIAAEAAGTYTVTRDDFETYLDPGYEPQAVAGPGPNQVTFINLFGHPEGYDIVVDVDPNTSEATVAKQEAWNCANFGCPYGVGSVEGTGFFFSCTGFITLDLEHTVAAGSFGSYKLELQRQ